MRCTADDKLGRQGDRLGEQDSREGVHDSARVSNSNNARSGPLGETSICAS
jgi:hypothetical protein